MTERKISGESEIGEVQIVAAEVMRELKSEFEFDRSSKFDTSGALVGNGLNCLTSSIIYSERLQTKGVIVAPVYLPKRHFSSGLAFHFGVAIHEAEHVIIVDPTLLKEGYGYGQVGMPTKQDEWLKKGNVWIMKDFSEIDMDVVLYPYFVIVDGYFLNELNSAMSDVLLSIRGKIGFEDGENSAHQILNLSLPNELEPIKAEIYHTVGKLKQSEGLIEDAFKLYVHAHEVGVLTERPLRRVLELQLAVQDKVWAEKELRVILELKKEEIIRAVVTWRLKAGDVNLDPKRREYYLSLVEFYQARLEGYDKFLLTSDDVRKGKTTGYNR